MPERRTRTGVEIARVGTYPLSTGPHTFTRQQLASAVTNATAQAPRIGIGHIDPRFNRPGHDGDPAFGLIRNLRLAEDGDVLLGDYDGVPSWLDDNLEVAYPGRSIEARVKGDDMKITAVKLLGTTEPGISTLKDLATAIAASVADGETSEDDAHRAISVLIASGPQPAGTPRPASPATPEPEEDIRMDAAALRSTLGLEPDASDEAVSQALDALKARPENTDGLVPASEVETKVEEAVAAAVAEEREKIAAAAGDEDTVKLDKATFEELKASAADGKAARAKQIDDERAAFIAAAVGDGKFPPARADHYRKLLDADPEGGKALIDALEKGLVPVTEIGASTGTDSPGDELATTGWFPGLTNTEA